MFVPVILSGGSGSRLWPLSRSQHPKPFIQLPDGQSLIQKAYARALAIDGVCDVITITNHALFFHTRDAFSQIAPSSVSHTLISEPCGRNSAAAVALAARYAQKTFGGEAILLVLSADHLIAGESAWLDAVAQAIDYAKSGQLVTFGIEPTGPKTGYGYIQAQENKVLRFVEKPDRQTAEVMLQAGGYWWNSGIFCLPVGSVLAAYSQFKPEMDQKISACLDAAETTRGRGWQHIEIPANQFESIESISFDYAIMEQSDTISMIPASFSWSDVGCWSDLATTFTQDEDENLTQGSTYLNETERCVVMSDDRLVATFGVKDLVIANVQDALLIADRHREQEIKSLVSALKATHHSIVEAFPTTHRPWGTFTVLQEGPGYKIKEIYVKPQASLSLQSHRHRSEHWVVVDGCATITQGDKVFDLEKNQSTYIPIGCKHRLQNHTEKPVMLVEVQCGSYLGEDDIIRYEDIYHRSRVDEPQV